MGEVTVLNIGCREYGYKNVLEYESVLEEYNVPKSKYKINIDSEKLKKYYKIASKALLVLEVAFLALGVTTVFAAPSGIDLGPIKSFSNEIWLTMLKALVYIAIPVFAWVGYIFAFAGTNSGKRTAAKITLFSLLGGIVFVAAAPWAGNQFISLVRRVFHV